MKDQAIKDWIKSLAIPPAWQEVEITTSPTAKIFATGRDTAGKKQYIYNPDWRVQQEEEKYQRIIRFASKLTLMRRVTGQHLNHSDVSRSKVLACMVRLIDNAYFRPGNDRYAKENDSYGLSTMRSRHLDIRDNELIFTYRGKAGVEQVKKVEDEKLSEVVAELDAIPGREIFKYFDEDGNKVNVSSDDLNDYIRGIMGEDFSAKDFRTWAGTSLAALALDEIGVADHPDQAEKNIREAIESVAKRLGNTPEVTKASYIDPRVIESYLDGRTIRFFKDQISDELENELTSPSERAVLKLLEYRLD